MEIKPDWYTTGTKKQIEEEIGDGFSLKGPGLYLSNNDTILVIMPNRTPRTFWNQAVESDEYYSAIVYNSSFTETIFSVLTGCIPIREDSRDLCT